MSQQDRRPTRKEEDILRLLATKAHYGTRNLNHSMKKYVEARTPEGVHIFNVDLIWQKIKIAARIIATVKNPEDVIVVSARPYGQRAVVKFSKYTGALSTSTSRWTPGTLTNQNTKKHQEPRLLIVTDPRSDRQAVVEASYVNIPTIALCDTDSSLEYVDCAIPCNNRDTKAISMVYWLLAREVLILRGQLFKDEEWDVLVDLFFHRDPEKDIEVRREDQADEQEAIGDKEEEGGQWDKQQDEEAWKGQ
eukprot:TRINITY_DN4552_c0_g4_i1.p1 TRINITY_DN4552_c0_g4~~TRINITY_DN4552_c0_g4_i1.p1  ORF type:complete len:249 (-),score=82.13 TRINITY_DN4552_c0_g4_i1:99-845(-)